MYITLKLLKKIQTCGTCLPSAGRQRKVGDQRGRSECLTFTQGWTCHSHGVQQVTAFLCSVSPLAKGWAMHLEHPLGAAA